MILKEIVHTYVLCFQNVSNWVLFEGQMEHELAVYHLQRNFIQFLWENMPALKI